MTIKYFSLVILIIFFSLGTLSLAEEANPSAETDKAIKKVNDNIITVKSSLLEMRQNISDARLEKQFKLEKLESSVLSLRKEWKEVSDKENLAKKHLQDIQEDLVQLENMQNNITDLLEEARKNIEKHFSPLDYNLYNADLEVIDSSLQENNNTENLKDILEMVSNLTLKHIDSSFTISTFKGDAVLSDGIALQGNLIKLGSIGGYFISKEPVMKGGIVRFDNGDITPHLYDFENKDNLLALVKLKNGGSSKVPIDLTGGIALQKPFERSFLKEIYKGGPVMVPIVILALLCLAFGLWKTVTLAKVELIADDEIEKITSMFSHDNLNDVYIPEKLRGPLAKLLEKIKLHKHLQRDQLEEVLHEQILSEKPMLDSKLSILSVGAAVAPLLGLLGTVTGMIHTFRLISIFGTGDARMLSGGISEALLTTEAGLIVAIPLLLLHALLSRRVKAIIDNMEKVSLAVLNTFEDNSDAG